jgi:hypothetical protein
MLAVFAFPAAFSNLGHGQNAFLSTGLFGAGGLLLARRPFLAGLCFGALIFKPHLGLLIPIALLAARQWGAIAGAAVSALGLIAASVLVLGVDAWRGFIAVSPLARATLEQDLVGPAKMVSVFAAVRLWHGDVALAYAAQGAVALAAALGVVLVFRRRADPVAATAALIAATLLASPFLLDYDLMLGAVPMAWLFSQGLKAGFRPWEKASLSLAFILPLIARLAAADLMLPLAPPVLAGLYLLILRRTLPAPAKASAATHDLGQGAARG